MDKAARCYRAGGLAAPQVRILLPPPSFRCGRAARRATVNREAQVRSLPSELHAPVVERAMTPDSQSGSCGFEPRRGYQPIGGLWKPRHILVTMSDTGTWP